MTDQYKGPRHTPLVTVTAMEAGRGWWWCWLFGKVCVCVGAEMGGVG